MTKFFMPAIIAIFALVFSACNKKDPEPGRLYGGTNAIAKKSIVHTFFVTDNGEFIYPSSQKGLDFLKGEEVCWIEYFIDSITSNKTKLYVGLTDCRAYDSLKLTPKETAGKDSFYEDIQGPVFVRDQMLLGYRCYQASDKTTQGMSLEKDTPIHNNDTLFLRLWHNNNGEAGYQVKEVAKSFNVGQFCNTGDTVIVSVKYKSGSTDQVQYKKFIKK